MLAIIGGTGFDQITGFTELRREKPDTPYGKPSAAITIGTFCSCENTIAFLPRHGERHTIAPHKINYRANMAALKICGASKIAAITAVGGIAKSLPTGSIVIPDQLIDYTWGRAHTFYDGSESSSDFMQTSLEHIDFSSPFSSQLRARLMEAAKAADIVAINSAVYGVTQGPRIETSAEVNRLDHDGVDIVGMTAMPEASLARELDMDYALICMVVNAAAGRSDVAVTMDLVKANLQLLQPDVLSMLEKLIPIVAKNI